MKNLRRLCLVLSAALAMSQEIQQPVVPITREPSHHFILQNHYVRVFDVIVPAHFTTRVHQHDHDYFYITLGDARVSNERVHENPATLTLKDGEVGFTKGGFAHRAVNLADTPFHNVTIEVLDPEMTKILIPEHSVEQLSPNSILTNHYGKIVVRQLTFLGEVGTCNQSNSSGPRLLVPVTDIAAKRRDRAEQKKPGEVVWLGAGQCSTVARVGDVPGRYVEIIFPPGGPEN